ncbi:hypothetical protein MSG28_012333 [Choristoneura fumiferana]|uniref:Uncharacterized protein n=1 Tax=Choristoneura fumiferana TaxID=7141 RepID=A0ACC0KD47_CHOFU|nr:hypothetical protein MSG28_012333 [Choristoneura fumiferana]
MENTGSNLQIRFLAIALLVDHTSYSKDRLWIKSQPTTEQRDQPIVEVAPMNNIDDYTKENIKSFIREEIRIQDHITVEKLQKDDYEKLKEMQRRAEQRINQSHSKSSSIETSHSNSKSMEQNSYMRNRGRNQMNRENRRRGAVKKHRRRRRRPRNCATKQPPFPWNITDVTQQAYGRNKYKNPSANRQHTSSGSRRTRSVSKPQHVEVLLVADRSMTEFHRDKNLETYLLTIMNMVSSLYMDPSIGNLIQVVVVKIILVEDSRAASELEVTTNADTTLSSFCRWQQLQNPKNDSHPQHHDVAILVTRQDICSLHNQPCSSRRCKVNGSGRRLVSSK